MNIQRADSKTRQDWMDHLRGFSVLLVIILHVVTILEVNYDLERPVALVELTQMFALFRMPALVFLSGILLYRSMRKGTIDYLTSKIRRILWPLLVWGVLTTLVLQDVDLFRPRVLLGLLLGIHHLWFLGFIFAFYIIALPLKRVHPLLVAGLALALSFASPDEGKYTERLFFLMSFFFIGAWVGHNLERWFTFLRSANIIVTGVALGACMLASCMLDFSYGPDFFLISVAMVAAVCAITFRFQKSRMIRMIAFVGRNSLIFYVTHYAVIYIAIGAALALGLQHHLLVGAAAAAVAIAVGWLSTAASKRSSVIGALFEMPMVPSYRRSEA